VREAQHRGLAAGVDDRVDDRAEAERLVVGMRDHGQHRRHAGWW